MTIIALPWLLNIFLNCLARFSFLKAFDKHSVLQPTKEKCEENVLEAMAIFPINSLEREELGYYVSFPFSILSHSQGAAMLRLWKNFY